jgi:hypothetical protein
MQRGTPIQAMTRDIAHTTRRYIRGTLMSQPIPSLAKDAHEWFD